VRLSYTKNGSGTEIIEESNYYPFGLKHQGYNQTQGNPSYKYQYNGKEIQEETGWSDFGARMYMSDIGRWGVIDPLAETSRRFNPYNYAYNNPISFIDPDGRKAMAIDQSWSWNVPTDGSGSGWFNDRKNFGSFDEFLKLTSSNEREKGGGGGSPKHIEPGSQIEWSRIKQTVLMQLALFTTYNFLTNGAYSDYVQSLNATLKNMNDLEASTQTYSLNKILPTVKGGLFYDAANQTIVINYTDDPNSIHEIIHGGHYEVNNIAFDGSSGLQIAQDITDEVSAYRAQYYYNPSSVAILPSSLGLKINSASDITAAWVLGIDSGTVYGPSGTSNTGGTFLDINSTKADIIRAYPQNQVFQNLPNNFIIKNDYPNLKFKK
jgi:RHS repeat-associated protein